jgi:WD40 repeat protein
MADNSNDKSSKLDVTGEFFSVGAPLHAVRAGYVRRRADELLYEALVAGRYAHVIAPDRSGKSSLIASTLARLENNGFQVAVLDLEQIGDRDAGTDAGRWYYSVAYRLLRQLRIRFDLQNWWQDKSVLSNRQRLVEFYAEIILGKLQQRVVVFVDEIQCIADLSFGDQLLASIRAAHNARATDPDFARLTFVLLGECDPLSLISEPELSPFNVTQSIPLDDFTRDDINLFATELNLEADDAEKALDRIFYWTRGQPYLTQKLARAVAREGLRDDVVKQVDRIVGNQLAGRAALHSEPQMSHIHRGIVGDEKKIEGLLNLYGRIRKGIDVAADLGSSYQRRLMAVGLLVVDDSGELVIRNRVYERVFTARWANENLPTHWRTPIYVVAALFVISIIPLWYTQWLPRSYQDVLTSMETELAAAETAWSNLRSFPGHADAADNLYRSFLRGRADISGSVRDIRLIAGQAADLPAEAGLPEQLMAEFWDRKSHQAMREERRDEALIATLESLVQSTLQRRNRAARLVADDYPLLLASLEDDAAQDAVFNPGSLLLTTTNGSVVSQWALGQQGLSRSDDWAITSLDVTPVLRRIIVDREGTTSRLGLTLRLSHPRLADLRIKLIAPSGRAVEVNLERDRASSSEEIRVSSRHLRGLLGESLAGTWSLSLRDEATGVAGHLVAWHLTLNSQGLVEDFERGLSIPDPVERETDQYWIAAGGRYAVARATQSDSARLWDLAFAKPVSTFAVNESEQIIGLDANARRLLTATLESVNLWDTTTGNRIESLPVGSASPRSTLTADRQHLFVQQPGDANTRFELWNIDVAEKDSELQIAGQPALVAVSANGQRIAIADYDRAVRVWDFLSGEMLVQIDMPVQPSQIELSAGGDSLGAVFGTAGIALWSVANPQLPLHEDYGEGSWRLRFSPSGARFIAGRAAQGFQLFDAADGRIIGPPVGVGSDGIPNGLLSFGRDEGVLVTSGPENKIRFWRIADNMPLPGVPSTAGEEQWSSSPGAVVVALPDASGFAIGDRHGHVHFVPHTGAGEALDGINEDVSFLGHNSAVRRIAVSGDGLVLVSVGVDNSLRVWDTAEGQPRQFIGSLPGSAVDRVLFSPDASLIGVLAGSSAAIVDARTGEVVAERELGERHAGIAFGPDNELFLGSGSGTLSAFGRDDAGTWVLRRLWQGQTGIRWLEASPRGRYLVLVDASNLAQQFDLAAGRIGDASVSLASRIEEVSFSPSGSRVLLRTARWIHRANSSPNGLSVTDTMFAPKPPTGARIVFGAPGERGYLTGSQLYLPVARDSGLSLVRLRFDASEGAGLFGNKEDLLTDWRARLGISNTEAE